MGGELPDRESLVEGAGHGVSIVVYITIHNIHVDDISRALEGQSTGLSDGRHSFQLDREGFSGKDRFTLDNLVDSLFDGEKTKL